MLPADAGSEVQSILEVWSRKDKQYLQAFDYWKDGGNKKKTVGIKKTVRTVAVEKPFEQAHLESA